MATTLRGPVLAGSDTRWRTRDIVVAAVIGVAFGVAFWAFGAVWRAFEFVGPIQNILYGAWLMPALVAPLIIRKPGAALFAELVAAGTVGPVGQLLGRRHPALSSSGLPARLVFAFTLYRLWSFPVLALAGLASAAAAFVHDVVVWYAGYATDVLVVIAVAMTVSGLILLPAASIALVRALRRAGVLEGFPD